MPTKNPSRLSDRNEQAELDGEVREVPIASERRTIATALEVASKSHVAFMGALVESSDSKPVKLERARLHMIDVFGHAMLVGSRVCGVQRELLSDREVRVLSEFVATELEYFSGLLDAAAGEMSREGRLRMYGGAVVAAFWWGWVATLPSTAVIDWKLGIAEHCPNCLQLASDSPYSKPGHGGWPLPTVPKAGKTRCLSNCKCFMRASAGTLDTSLNNRIEAEVSVIDGLAVHPSSAIARSVASLYQPLVQAYAWHLRVATASSGERASFHLERARVIAADIEELAGRNRHRVQIAATRAEILAQVLVATSAGMRFIYPDDLAEDLLVMLAAILLPDEGAAHGLVDAVQGTGVVIGGDFYDLSVVGGNLLFVR